jgi:hypothetical protein
MFSDKVKEECGLVELSDYTLKRRRWSGTEYHITASGNHWVYFPDHHRHNVYRMRPDKWEEESEDVK